MEALSSVPSLAFFPSIMKTKQLNWLNGFFSNEEKANLCLETSTLIFDAIIMGYLILRSANSFWVLCMCQLF